MLFENCFSRDLADLIRTKALKTGSVFRLASGATSTYYLDCKNVTLDGAGCKLVGELFCDLIRFRIPAGVQPVAIGGLSIGADPIIASTLVAFQRYGLNLAGCMIRKDEKDHGMKGRVVGPVKPGMKVLVVEDVCTTGKSSLSAVQALRDFGCTVDIVACIIDREEGGHDTLTGAGLRLMSLFTIRDFGIQPPVRQ